MFESKIKLISLVVLFFSVNISCELDNCSSDKLDCNETSKNKGYFDYYFYFYFQLIEI